MSAEYELTINITMNGVEHVCDIGFDIISKGTIYVGIETDWMTDPPERPAVRMDYIDTDSAEVEEYPEFEVVWLDIWEKTGLKEEMEFHGKEEVDSFFVLNPDLKKTIIDAVEKYLERLADDLDSHAYDVIELD
jgi:hypothetical protein